MKNVRPFDRFLRAAVAVVLFEAGYFWLGGPWNWICFGLGAIILLTAIMGICPLYRLLGIASAPAKQQRRSVLLTLAALLLAALVIGGAYGSMFFSRKLFLEDFNVTERILQAGPVSDRQGRPGRVQSAILNSFVAFLRGIQQPSMSNYRPYSSAERRCRTHQRFEYCAADLDWKPIPLVRTGDLHEAHLALEKVRPVFQDMFKRNEFSMLSVALVDFHDAMETILAAATSKNVAGVTSIYPGVSDKLKVIEAEDNDAEIQEIRKALETLLATAKAGDSDSLPGKGHTLKSNFIKVYLNRG